jgi:oxygen-independent coproporphyrinogen III oxidase
MQKCVYCDFLSAPAGEDVKRKYIEALVCEINITCGLYNDRLSGYQVKTIFFGGGTPSAVKPEYIRDIMKCLNEHFDIAEGAEVTIECNPGTLDINKADIYRECGINRISFGLQSADNIELKMLGRIHTFEQFKESLSIAEKAGFDNINVDIMSALPGQTMESYKRTVEKVLECNVKHISAYSLIVEEGTPLYDRLDTDYPELPDEDTERQMYYYTQDSLASAGYVHYEISNYARPGYECRHNISYWERTDYLGFGVGAASLFEEIRHTNITDINMYIDKCGGMINAGSCMDNNVTAGNYNRLYEIYDDIQKLSLNDRMEEFMFLGLRKIDGISKAEFEKTFSKNIADVYGKVIQENVLNGLLVDDGDVIKLTDRGVDISNVVMADFLL